MDTDTKPVIANKKKNIFLSQGKKKRKSDTFFYYAFGLL